MTRIVHLAPTANCRPASSKRADSIYCSGPSKAWLKAKCLEVSEHAVAGVLSEPGSPPMALMAMHDAERRYVGSAFIAPNQAMRERLWKRVQDQHGPPAKVSSARAKPCGLSPVSLAESDT